jgi:hypothetical protein
MKQDVIVHMDSEPVRFTPDGRISVLDAIRTLCNDNCPRAIWKDIRKKYPEILRHCDQYSFQGKAFDPVVNNEGWEKLWMLLIDYVQEPNKSSS